MAGTQVREGDKVNYDLCAGPAKSKVPPLLGLSKGDAQKALDANKLQANFQDIDGTEKAGVVVGADPAAGTELPEGSSVTVKISKGNQKNLPDNLIGLSYADASAQLRALGFTNITSTTRSTSNPDEVNKVIAMDPSPGSGGMLTSKRITLIIGKSSEPSSPPASPSPSAS